MTSEAERTLGNERQASARAIARWVLFVTSVLLAALFSGCTGEILEPAGAGPGPNAESLTTPTCPAGQVPCAGGACADPANDSANCGVCGRVCPTGLVCQGGTCTALCAVGDRSCGGACVAVASDVANCGDCGRVCAPGEFCSAGACGATCAFQVCDAPSGQECADTATSSRHCGACGAACPSGQSCLAGICQLVCPSGQVPCGGRCVATGSDAQNCGGCGVVCPGGACLGGSCGCPQGQALCGGICQDVATNPAMCGACDRACSPGSTCVAGQCSCGPGQVSCAGVCVDLTANLASCGTCGHACASGEICDQGTCRSGSVGCSGGLALCGGGCVDISTSSANCGDCNRPCLPGQACTGGACGCPGGQAACGGSCVDVLANNTHCGACDQPCTSGRTCVSGVCACPGTQGFCGGACVDNLTNVTHCSACDRPCAPGQTCTGGVCLCPGGAASCGGGCVDTQTNGDHCGGCDRPCMGGSVCNGGACACSGGQTLCEGQCVDTQTSLQHCGTCGQECFAGEVCTAGVCQGPLGADGCSGSARNLTVRSIAAYQSIKIPIMEGQQAVVRGSRVADVIQGRETLFRVFVDVGGGWAGRDLSARLTLVNGAATDQYFAKQRIGGSSGEADTASTFQIYVPPEKILGDTRYSVEVVECGSGGSGEAGIPRFPASGDVALEARKTGPLKIGIVPVRANSRAPDTSEAAQTVYRRYLAAMYPTEDVQLTLASELSTGYPINWTGLLDQIRAKRQDDRVASDVYYYGWVAPASTFREYCQSSCTAGIGYVGSQSSARAAVGVGFADEASASTMAHEVGHNHGRNHAPCAPGSISGVDQGYPHAGALLGVWGYDPRTRVLYDPSRATDIMGYCSNKWVSDYTYRAFTERVAQVNGSFLELVGPERVAAFRVLIADPSGVRWGIPFARPAEAFGNPEPAEALDETGAVIDTVTVYWTDISHDAGASILVPPPEPGWFAVRVPGFAPLPFDGVGGAP